jgi:hypothetical protein
VFNYRANGDMSGPHQVLPLKLEGPSRAVVVTPHVVGEVLGSLVRALHSLRRGGSSQCLVVGPNPTLKRTAAMLASAA